MQLHARNGWVVWVYRLEIYRLDQLNQLSGGHHQHRKNQWLGSLGQGRLGHCEKRFFCFGFLSGIRVADNEEIIVIVAVIVEHTVARRDS